MTDADFGVELPENSMLGQVLRHAPKADYLTSRLLLIQAYQTTFNIFDHLSNAQRVVGENPDDHHPLASIELHPAEDLIHTFRTPELLDLYIKLKIKDYTGLSWVEFMDLPREYSQMIMDRCAKELSEENKKTNQIVKNLEQNVGPPA